MLDEKLKAQLKGYLVNLRTPIELVASLDHSVTAARMRDLLTELTALDERVRWRESEEAGALRPSFEIRSVDHPERQGICFAGLPMGHEFTSLVLALLHMGGHPPKADAALLEQARNLRGEYHFTTFISLSCQVCPEVVQALNLLAVVNPGVRHTMVDGGVFPTEVERREILSVPTVLLGEQVFGQGRMTLADILRKLDAGSVEREAARLSTLAPYDMLVVGGGPAGAAAAIYAARKGIRTGVLAERFGGQVLDTMGIENFVSVQATEGPRLVAAMENHVREYAVDILEGQTATAVDSEETEQGRQFRVTTASGAAVLARAVILATGARWREMNVPGEREYRGRGVAYCPHCDGPLFRGKRVAVVGGGNSGIEAAIDLAGLASHVSVLEFDGQLRADEVLQRKLRSLPNVTVYLNAQTTEVLGDGKRVTGLTVTDRKQNRHFDLNLEGVFVQIGLLPNSEWLRDTVQLTPRGEIEIDERCETSMPGIFAAGDVTTVPYKQIVIAMGEGSKAALSAFDYLIRSSVDQGETAAA